MTPTRFCQCCATTLAFSLASSCGDPSSEGGPARSGSGGATDGTGAAATGGNLVGDGDGDGDGGTGGAEDPGTGGRSLSSGGNAIGGVGGSSAGGAGDEDGGDSGDGDGDDPGPCGDRVGTPTIDGLLQATKDLAGAVDGAVADFDTAIQSIESLLSLPGTGDFDVRVDAVVAALSLQVSDNTDGLWIYGPPTQCNSDRRVAQESQLSCEKALCGGGEGVDAETIAIECTGPCWGACNGGCSDEWKQLCMTEVSDQSCEGICEGTCELTAPGACDGLCTGTCSGTCTASDPSGCIGECDGSCQGTCASSRADLCEGSCSGTCLSEDSGGCDGQASCGDSVCLGECRGACGGKVIPAAGVPSCEHSADCQLQAGALSLSRLSCTVVALHHAFAYTGSPQSEAEFTATMKSVIEQLETAEHSFNLLNVLVTGRVSGEVVYEHAPLDQLVSDLQGAVGAGASGSLFSTLPDNQVACVLPALVEAVGMLSGLGASSAVVLEAQETLVDSSRRGFD